MLKRTMFASIVLLAAVAFAQSGTTQSGTTRKAAVSTHPATAARRRLQANQPRPPTVWNTGTSKLEPEPSQEPARR